MDFTRTNRTNWNQRTEIHVKSEFYDVNGFLNGACSLNEIETSELGDIENKTLLHLQCHFGLDSLSLARRGAKVTGVDFSDVAIAKANALKEALNLKADFICSDIYDYGRAATSEFDIVFTSYGVVCWLPDLHEWAGLIARRLKPNGIFYMAEFHPLYDIISGYPYFHNPVPDLDVNGTYTENSGDFRSECHTWSHPISDVVNALIRNGIILDQLNEYPYSPYRCFDGLEERAPGKFYLSFKGQDAPLVYAIKGIKRP